MSKVGEQASLVASCAMKYSLLFLHRLSFHFDVVIREIAFVNILARNGYGQDFGSVPVDETVRLAITCAFYSDFNGVLASRLRSVKVLNYRVFER